MDFLTTIDLEEHGTTLGVAALAIAVSLYLFFSRPGSVVSRIPGTSGKSWILGAFYEYRTSDVAVKAMELQTKYGDVARFGGFLRENYLQVSDPKALTHILQSNAYTWEKSEPNRERLIRLTGRSLVFCNGAEHKKQRRILTPAFLAPQIDSQSGIMYEYTRELRDRWSKRLAGKPKGEVINISTEYSKAALDILGKAGFSHEFEALSKEDNPLAEAFESAVAKSFVAPPTWVLCLNEAATYIPLALYNIQNYIPSQRFAALRDTMILMRDSSKSILDQALKQPVDTDSKDSLNLLIGSFHNSGLSAEQITNEMTGLIIGGHETSANTLAWTCYTLAQLPHIQEKLRAEVLAAFEDAGEDEIPVDILQKLPYLDFVTREALRLHPVVERIERVNNADDVVPLSKPIKLTDGTVVDHLPIKKGQRVFVYIHTINWSREIWGDNVMEFKPERWENGGPKAAFGIPTVYSHLITFGAGSRACIGFRMAILEIKVVLSMMLANFSFEPRDGPGTPMPIKRVSAMNFMAPVLLDKNGKEEEVGMRLKVIPLKR